VLHVAQADMQLAASSAFIQILRKDLVPVQNYAQTFLQTILSSVDNKDPGESLLKQGYNKILWKLKYGHRSEILKAYYCAYPWNEYKSLVRLQEIELEKNVNFDILK